MNFKERLLVAAKDHEISMSDRQAEQFDLFYHYLIEQNKVMNLTAIVEEDQVIVKHFLDSISCRRIVDMDKVTSIIDVGTGAGFPGIPLKIMYPEIKFVLIDSLNKRVKFLKNVIELLHLDEIEVYHGRAEDLARDPALRAGFDLCVSRAVANLSTLSEYCIPFVRVNGYFVSYKAGKGLEEIKKSANCMKLLGSKIDQVLKFQLSMKVEESESIMEEDFDQLDSNDEALRVLIRVKKLMGTSRKYPRKAGVPSKNPL